MKNNSKKKIGKICNQRRATPNPSSRLVQDLGKWAGLSDIQSAQVGKTSNSIELLRLMDIPNVSKTLDIQIQNLEKLKDCSLLTLMDGISVDISKILVERGINIKFMIENEPETIFKKIESLHLEDLFGLSQIRRWQVAAKIIERQHVLGKAKSQTMPRGKKKAKVVKKDVQEKRVSSLLPHNMVVTASVSTWKDIARQFYKVLNKDLDDVAKRLSDANIANEMDKKDVLVPAGTRILLPNFPSTDLKPLDKHTETLQGFASYLAKEDAEKLVSAGFMSTSSLQYLNPESESFSTGVNASTLCKLKIQSQLNKVAGISNEVAQALTLFGGYRDILEIAKDDPQNVRNHIKRAAGRGLDITVIPETSEVANWLSIIPVFVITAIMPTPTLDQVCKPGDSPKINLENYYSYKLLPSGLSSIELSLEKDQKESLLTKVGVMLQDADVKAHTSIGEEKGKQLADEVMRKCNIIWEDLERWGFDSLTSNYFDDKLADLAMYLSHQLEILDLLQPLCEGHEAFHRREYSLALSSYNKAEEWFATHDSVKYLWTNRVEAGKLISPFREPQPAGLGNAEWQYWKTQMLGDIHSKYYQTRSSGNNALAELQLLWVDYHKYMLYPFNYNLKKDEPFRKYLYHIRNFILPLCESDVYLQLGNFCEALNQCMMCHTESYFTNSILSADEKKIAHRLNVNGGSNTYPILAASLDTTGYDQYYYEYLNPVEKRLIDLKVAHILQIWGEFYERRAKPWIANDNDTQLAKQRYAQVIRILFPTWSLVYDKQFADFDSYLNHMLTNNLNPLAIQYALSADAGLMRIDNGLNFLGYSPNYIPIWAYSFLLSTARYYAERAKSLERDSLNFLSSAESELGNQRSLSQQVATATSQLDVESRRLDEADATIEISNRSVALADQRLWNNSNRQIELEFLGPIKEALGTVGGTISGASSFSGLSGGNPFAAVGGGVFGGITGYLSSSIEISMQKSELQRQQLELQKAKDLSLAELNRANISASIVQMQRAIAASNLAFTRSNFDFAMNKTLNTDFWYEASKRMQEMAQKYLDQAIQLAFMTEQAFEFAEGRRIDRIKFDYSSAENYLAGDALLSDLDSIEGERIISGSIKRIPIKHSVSLRVRDFQAFEDFKRSGSITFDTTVSDFDLDHPGTYARKLIDVEVEVSALVGQGGIRGTLTKMGVSYERFQDRNNKYPVNGNVVSDWIRYTPTQHKIAAVVQPEETLILSSFDIRRDSVILRAREPGEQLGVFEGGGLASTWRLEISPCSNDFDLNTITDINLIFYYTAQFDPVLKEAVELERRKLIASRQSIMQKTKGYSFRESLPDQFYHLLNPSENKASSLLRRIISFRVDPEEFPVNEINRKIDGIILAFLSAKGPIEMHPRITSKIHSPGYDEATNNTSSLAWVPNATESLLVDPSLPYYVVATKAFINQSPEDLWFLEILAEDNPNLAKTNGTGMPIKYGVDATTGDLILDSNGDPIPDPNGENIFDENKLSRLNDLWLIFRYGYEIAGECGNPVIFWCNFSKGLDAFLVLPPSIMIPNYRIAPSTWSEILLPPVSLVVGSRWHRDNNSGSLKKRIAGPALFLPATMPSLTNFELASVMILPKGGGAEAGFVLKYGVGATNRPFYYIVKFINHSANSTRVDLEIQKIRNNTTTQLALIQDIQLLRGSKCRLNIFFVNGTIKVAINDHLLVTAQDNDISSGSVGFFAKDDGAEFEDIHISDLAGRV
ncbi:MAG: hypothetical protein HZA84_01155 [Thaumarchaeota archaeon]|nr:hypothetical protein [Nitrososphaerota archaeon]